MGGSEDHGGSWEAGGILGAVCNPGPGIREDHTGVVQGRSGPQASGPYPHRMLGWWEISVAASRGLLQWFLRSTMPRVLVSVAYVPHPSGSL